ncbi:Zinc/iron permease [Radiomyces spectabilis]|uniref:Zinc/iron permease n=1 Tax=Radiomyces spectabilis TaxID=64574 RepID=UPI00221FDF44|nr:Zinc/iron permease [Radiomyces spectabilis]KAI8368245.1 Zinc/iron permease [Radiomyces spectabilis]
MVSLKWSWLLFFVWNGIVKAQELAPDSEEGAECSAEQIQDYNMPLRIGAIFIILATSAIGVFAPMILHRISPYSKGSIRDWVLTFGRFFGTGVILATAFVHMLPEALENFESPCLSAGWKSYSAFAGVFCMLASFALQLLELAAIANVERVRAKKALASPQMDLEKASYASVASESSLSTAAAANVEETPQHVGHVHSAGLLEGDQSIKNIGTLVLELGIVMHSIIIGITLSNTGQEEFVTLLIAIVFHQFFEGVALGTRVNDMHACNWKKPFIMGTVFTIMTPLGAAIGIGIHSSFNPNSSSSILASAILDSLSAGILLYNGYVSLMSLEINQNEAFRRSSLGRKAISFLAMYAGAGLMALLGKWA